MRWEDIVSVLCGEKVRLSVKTSGRNRTYWGRGGDKDSGRGKRMYRDLEAKESMARGTGIGT